MAMAQTAYRTRPALRRTSFTAAGRSRRAKTPLFQVFLCPSSVKVTDELCIKDSTTIYLACGSGGFLVSSFDRMMRTARKMGIPSEIVRESLYGFDTNPTVWSLAALNMFFRGDGKSHIENVSCFDEKSIASVSGKFTKALLNPPFSQTEEPERDFIDASMNTLQTMGLMAVVVKSGIFADDDNARWRNDFLKKHTVLGMISLPGDLFYPMARGNGGSAVRVLVPKYKMTYSELVWFAAQINMQRWRFFYGRMAIQKRLKQLSLKAPNQKIKDGENTITKKIMGLAGMFSDLMKE